MAFSRRSGNDGEKYYLKNNPSEIIKVGPSESMSKKKKIPSIHKV